MRIRFEFSKGDAARFLSQLDMVRLFERAARRAGLPIAYTQGFNPHPKISFGPALAVGIIGEREYADLEFESPVDVEKTILDLGAQMPSGIRIRSGKEVPKGSPSINAVVDRGEYVIFCVLGTSFSKEEINNAILKILSQKEIHVEKKTKKGMEIKNIRPGIYALEGEIKSGNLLTVKTLLKLSSSGSVSPFSVFEVFLKELNVSLEQGSLKIVRKGIFAYQGGRLLTPLEILH
ncbi:MAG TPA: hypothetical protein DEA47_03490 [Peptococcaceae bacterium]|nr:MAG: Radical sam protein, putative [Clostridia bacterium 41_269]HBT20413.1 hypothetical protein [Peptococcaceae bacterium]